MRRAIACGALLAVSMILTGAPAPAATSPVTAVVGLPRHSAVVASTRLAADYYRGTYAHTTLLPTNGWSWATYAQGVQALYRQSGDQRYLSDGLAWGRSNAWGIQSQETNPDTIKAGETYFDLNAIDPTASLAVMDASMARDLTGLPASQYDWIDALFMGLPDWTRWAARTGNPAYLDKLDALYTWELTQGGTSSRCAGKPVPQAGLFDANQGLWYRDCTFIGAKDVNGQPIFWGRGNGWTIAAMAQVLESLPAGDPRGATYAGMLRTMAARLVQLQGTDGFWRSSLTDPALYPQPETSGTSLITYALAYGIKAGILDMPTYLPAVVRAWDGLTRTSLQPSGFVSSCQGPGIGPGPSYPATAPRTAPTSTSSGTVNADSPPFCVGAFLLAGSAVAQLTSSPSTGRPVTCTSQQVGNEARRVDDGDVTTRWSASGFPQAVTIDLGARYRLSNAMVVPYLDRAYRYRVETSTDNVNWQLVVDQTASSSTGSRLDDFGPGTVSARYARLTVVGISGTSTTWVSIQEFAVFDRLIPRVDLARAHPTTATTSLTGHGATYGTDGSWATWWSAAKVPTTSSPQSLLVDLGTRTPIDTVQVFPRVGYGPNFVTVSVSADGQAYSTVAVVHLANAEGPSSVEFPQVNARWVRLTSTSSYSASTVSVREFEVFRAIGS